jgi:signal peptidase
MKNLQIVFGTQNPFYVVSSGSMIPELQVFDVLVVQGNDPFDSVKVGDIIVFDRPSGHDRVIVHRVAAIIDDDPYTIRTKGDANPASIPGTDFPITEDEYIGKVAHVIPQIGYITRILTPPINYIIIGIIVVVMIVKQIAKGKKERELVSDVDFDLLSKNNSEESPSKFDDLDKIPKDKEYTDISEEIRKKALEEEGINLDSEEKNKDSNTSTKSENNNLKDSKKEKPEG